MKATIASALLLLPLAATAAESQQRVISDRVAQSMPTTYQAPDCGLKSGHFKVSSGATYLKTGIETDVPENQKRALDSGERVLLEAMQQNNQDDNPAAWYYLGRIYLQRGDIYGADSALTRAEKMAPACAKEIDLYRRNAWVALIKGGNGFEEQKNLDSALVHLPAGGRGVSEVADPVLPGGRGHERAEAGATARPSTSAGRSRPARTRPTRPRSEDPEPLRVQPGRAAAQRAKACRGGGGVRAVPQVGAERRRGQARSRRAHTAAKGRRTRRRRWSRRSWPPGGSAAAAGGAPGAGAGQRRPDERRRQPLQRQEVRRGRGSVRQGGPGGALQPRRAVQSRRTPISPCKDGAKLLATAQRLSAIEPMNENSLKLVGEGLQAVEAGGRGREGRGEGAGAAGRREGHATSPPAAADATLTGTATGREAQTPRRASRSRRRRSPSPWSSSTPRARWSAART